MAILIKKQLIEMKNDMVQKAARRNPVSSNPYF